MSPREVHLVLVGAGHAHIEVLRRWSLVKPLPNVKITLVCSEEYFLYSKMLPGLVTDFYKTQQLQVNLKTLATAAGAVILRQDCNALDALKQEVTLSNSGPIFYDYISFDFGPLDIPVVGFDKSNWRMANFVDIATKINRWKQDLNHSNFSVLGGSPDSFELTLAIKQAMPNSNVSLVSELPIPTHWQQALQRQKIETKNLPVKQLIGHSDYVEVHCKGLVLKTGAVLVCNGNPALSIFAQAGLGQLIEVIASLNSPIFSNIFAVGDCAHFRPTNGLAKSDDFALKAAPVLFENLYRSVQGRYDWQKFVPRRSIFRLQNYGLNQAMLEVGGLRLRNSWFLKAKNFLDQKFIKKFE